MLLGAGNDRKMLWKAHGAWQGSGLPLGPHPAAQSPCDKPGEGAGGRGDRPAASQRARRCKRRLPRCGCWLRWGNYFSPASFFLCLLNKIITDGLIHLSHNQNSSQDGVALDYITRARN
ncbi:hypothetical protein VULLAG_LOCUS7811 [Vulpes lagopus]